MSRAYDVPADDVEVEQFLGRLDLAHLAPKFREEEVDMRDLRLMTQEDFEKMGVKVGPRVRICDALQRLRKDEKAACSVAVAAQVLPVPTTFALLAAPAPNAASAVAPAAPTAARPNVSLRAYQSRIVDEVTQENTIVVLPTGSGKTLIAAEAVVRLGTPALFLVPTCLLVEQQAAAVRSWTGKKVGEYMGSKALPESFDVLVSTPEAFLRAQASRPTLHWSAFKLVIFDEVHHCADRHPYAKAAAKLRKLEGDLAPHVLGLSASLTYAVGEDAVKNSVDRLCSMLRVTHIATVADEKELRAGGYTGPVARSAELSLPVLASPTDGNGVLPHAERKPHRMADTFFERIQSGSATLFSRNLMECIRALEAQVASNAFTSPLLTHKVAEWGAIAKKTAPALEAWYEALRLLVVSWEEADDAAVTFLRMSGCDVRVPGRPSSSHAQVLAPARSAPTPQLWQWLT
jgi:hypothetical protein